MSLSDVARTTADSALTDFLQISHNDDGSLKTSALGGSSSAIVLISDGAGGYKTEATSTLTTAQAKASTLPKEFRGPTDPSGVAGWTLADFDTWVQTT